MLKIYSNFIPQNELAEAVNVPELINKPISVFNDYPNVTSEQLNFNPFNILMVLEPNQLFGIHDWAIQNHNLFSCILTGGQEILDKCPNALLRHSILHSYPFLLSSLSNKSSKESLTKNLSNSKEISDYLLKISLNRYS